MSSASRWVTSATAAPGTRSLVAGDQVDPGVVLDLADRAAQHLDDGHGLPPAAAGRCPGQDDQAFGLPAHAGGQVVQPEELRQGVRILGAAFHRIEHPELPLQQRLVAPGQAAEHVADPLAQLGLADRRLHCRPLHRPEGVRDPGHFPGPGPQGQWRRLGRDIHVLTPPQPAHHRGQALIRQGPDGHRGTASARG